MSPPREQPPFCWEQVLSLGYKISIPGLSLPLAGHRVSLSGRSLPSAGQRSPPGVQDPLSPGHRSPRPGTRFTSPGAASSPMGTGPLPGGQGPPRQAQPPPVRGALSAHRCAAHPTRTRRLQERTGRLGRSLLPQRSAAQRIREDAARPLPAPPGMCQPPAARRGPRVCRVRGRWSGPHPPALRGLSHLPRAYINAAARVPAALPRVTLRPPAAAGWLWTLRRARLAPRPRPGAPRRRRLSLSLSLSRCHSLSRCRCLSLCSAPAPAAPPPLLAPPLPPQPRARAHRQGWSQRPTPALSLIHI